VVTALGVANVTLGALHLLVCPALAALIASASFASSVLSRAYRGAAEPPPPPPDPFEASFPLVTGLVLAGLLLSLLFTVAGAALLTRLPWGRFLTLALGGVAGLLALALLFDGLRSGLAPVNGAALLLYGGHAGVVLATLSRRKFAAEFVGRRRRP